MGNLRGIEMKYRAWLRLWWWNNRIHYYFWRILAFITKTILRIVCWLLNKDFEEEQRKAWNEKA